MANGNKRYYCSFVKEVDGELKPNVVVIVATSKVTARSILCETHGVVDFSIPKDRLWFNDQLGIKTIRLSETNTYVDDEGVISHDPRT